jgi:hypothetical protein
MAEQYHKTHPTTMLLKSVAYEMVEMDKAAM